MLGRTARRHFATKAITSETIPAQYAVRGEVVTRSWEVEKKLKSAHNPYPFTKLTPANIGNPQACGLKPFNYHRELLALMAYPELLDTDACKHFHPDVVERARRYVARGVKVGAYSHSKGVEVLREEVAEWFAQRDNTPVPSVESVYLTDGASTGIKTALEIIVGSPQDGVLIPIPQYPLYTATIAKLNGSALGYFLDESRGWGLDIAEMERAIADARAKGVKPKAVVVINPGNPTGSILSRDDIAAVLRLCEREGLAVLADEVYQQNVYGERPFVSFRSVLKAEGLETELFSFHSASKGLAGECGLRGGIMQVENLDPAAEAQLYKLSSLSLCANILGQVAMTSIVTGPAPGGASYAEFQAEFDRRLASFRSRSQLVFEKLNKIPGISCQNPEGAMYAFPKIELPPKAVEAAKAAGKAPDLFYALECLERTGLMVVPGSGFGQREGTYHFRTTILPPEEELHESLDRFEEFHKEFLAKYSS